MYYYIQIMTLYIYIRKKKKMFYLFLMNIESDTPQICILVVFDFHNAATPNLSKIIQYQVESNTKTFPADVIVLYITPCTNEEVLIQNKISKDSVFSLYSLLPFS